jgi:hypothetical protein
VQPIGADGLAILPTTLPIHKGRGEYALVDLDPVVEYTII